MNDELSAGFLILQLEVYLPAQPRTPTYLLPTSHDPLAITNYPLTASSPLLSYHTDISREIFQEAYRILPSGRFY